MKNTLSYTAGYIDGDGCFSINKKINPIKYHARITVSSTDQEILRFFKQEYGGSVFLTNTNKKFKNFKPIYQWVVVGKEAFDLTQKLMPYLIEKKLDALFLINFFKEKSKHSKDRMIQELKEFRNRGNYVSIDTINDLKKIPFEGVFSITDYSYLAGFIDAECCFGISKCKPKNRPNHVYKIGLQCNNTKAEVFRWTMKRFGGHVNFIAKKRLNPLHRDQISWRLSSRTLFYLLPHILPLLKHKQPVCAKLIEFYNTTLPNGGARHTDSFRKSYASTLLVRDKIVDQIHALNFRGNLPI